MSCKYNSKIKHFYRKKRNSRFSRKQRMIIKLKQEIELSVENDIIDKESLYPIIYCALQLFVTSMIKIHGRAEYVIFFNIVGASVFTYNLTTNFDLLIQVMLDHTSLFITTHIYDSVYFGIIFDIDIYEPKQSKTATTSINKSNNETFTVIGTLVVDIYQRTQTEKTLLVNFFQQLFACSI